MLITVRAPNRIDLAGGTLDISPLYMLLGDAVTVNAAITVYSRVTLEASNESSGKAPDEALGEDPGESPSPGDAPGRGIWVRAEDTGLETGAPTAAALPDDDRWRLITTALRWFDPPVKGLRVLTRNEAPRGSGLGASSALLLALCSGLNTLTGTAPLSMENLISLSERLEARVIMAPTGSQDYYAAAFGGLNVIRYTAGGPRVEPVPLNSRRAEELARRIVLAYSGESHNSASPNWMVFKRFVEQVPATVEAVGEIKEIALATAEAVGRYDWASMGRLMAREWSARCRLAPGIETPALKRLAGAAEKAGALGWKGCGAGAGGSFAAVTEPDNRDAVAAALEEAGGTVIPMGIDRRGLKLSAELSVHHRAEDGTGHRQDKGP